MARQPRLKSGSGIYHITVRGIDKMDLFLDDEERQMYLNILEKCKGQGKYILHGYCLMSNHVHLLLQEQEDTIDRIMKRVGVMYAKYFNTRYDRHGPLFEDRFASEVIDSDAYFLAALRYIHRNPVKAGMVASCEDWVWSSAKEYMYDDLGLADKDFVYGVFGADRVMSIAEYWKFMQLEDERGFLDVRDRDEDLAMAKKLWDYLVSEGYEGDELLYRFLSQVDLPSRTLAAITGIGRSVIRRMQREFFG